MGQHFDLTNKQITDTKLIKSSLQVETTKLYELTKRKKDNRLSCPAETSSLTECFFPSGAWGQTVDGFAAPVATLVIVMTFQTVFLLFWKTMR